MNLFNIEPETSRYTAGTVVVKELTHTEEAANKLTGCSVPAVRVSGDEVSKVFGLRRDKHERSGLIYRSCEPLYSLYPPFDTQCSPEAALTKLLSAID